MQQAIIPDYCCHLVLIQPHWPLTGALNPPALTPTSPRPADSRLPPKAVAFHLPLADDTNDQYFTYSDWQPKLYDYQQKAANVLVSLLT